MLNVKMERAARGISRRRFLRLGGAVGVVSTLGVSRNVATAAAPLKVGLVLVSPAAEMGWTKQHTLGVAAIKQTLGDAAEISVIDNVFQPQDAERVFRSLAASGHQLIYGTSFSHGIAMARAAPQFGHRGV